MRDQVSATVQIPQVNLFRKNGVLKNFAKFRKICVAVSGLRPATLLKMTRGTGVFLWIFAKFSKTPFFTEHFLMTAYVKIVMTYSDDTQREIIEAIFRRCSSK